MNKQAMIEQQLEEHLLNRRWEISDHLPPERELCVEFSVSRGTLRSALQALCGRGILEMRRGSGTYVRMLPHHAPLSCSTQELLVQRLEGFLLLMPLVVSRFTARITPAQVTKLELTLPEVGLALRTANLAAFVQMQARFLMEIIHGVDNPALTTAMSHLVPEGRGLLRVLQRQHMQQHEELFALLARLLSACRKVEPEAASRTVQDYAEQLIRLTDACAEKP